ncbi:hypothetical protein RND71_010530 [Anisodus tanguticus]|uniref:GCK domain-containing protein n=1 Tax=Anisodus tanguticus TaxID=243964 RepID=A0AAE1SJE3_9SOLA|nr:hypothetical protein RND71_010530 [Anisodus tanguticus]
MSSSKSPQTHEQIPENDTVSESKVEKQEEEECGFCIFMKEGGCKDPFTEWEKCVEQGEKNKEDIVEKCFQVTSALQKCMEAHSDYYAPILQVEKDVESKVIAEFHKNKELEGSSNKMEHKEEGL